MWCSERFLMTMNAPCDLDRDFRDVLPRLVYYMTEACIVSSLSRCDTFNLLILLSSIGRYQFESDE
jgi:hypothetical protein